MMKNILFILLNLVAAISSICSAISIVLSTISLIGIFYASITDNEAWLAIWLVMLLNGLAGALVFTALTRAIYLWTKKK